MSEKLIKTAKSNIEQALTSTYGVKSKGFDKVMRKTGKKLPYRLRKEARYLSEAEAHLKHPRTQRLIDEKRITRAENRISKYTARQNPSRDRARQAYGWGSGLVINLILFGVVFYALLLWIGAV